MTRLRAAGPSAARTRARWAFWSMVAVNAVMLWFFLGMTASVNWSARVLDDDTLQACATQALQGRGVFLGPDDVGEARFAGDATVRFAGTIEDYDEGDRSSETVEIECTVEPTDGDSDINDLMTVVRARVVG